MHPIVEALSPLTVLDINGATVPVPTLWAERPRVLVWLRHFG